MRRSWLKVVVALGLSAAGAGGGCVSIPDEPKFQSSKHLNDAGPRESGADSGPSKVTCGGTVCPELGLHGKPCCAPADDSGVVGGADAQAIGPRCGVELNGRCVAPARQPSMTTNGCPGDTSLGVHAYGCCDLATDLCGFAFKLGDTDFGCVAKEDLGLPRGESCLGLAQLATCGVLGTPCVTGAPHACCTPSFETGCVTVTPGRSKVCSTPCTTNADCDSGCCAHVPNLSWTGAREATGACADASACSPSSFRCGGTRCEPVGNNPPCCTGAAGDRCGIKLNDRCVELSQPGTLTKQCPTQPVLGLAEGYGCCRPEGTCGLDFGLLGTRFGCVDPVPLGLPPGATCTVGIDTCSGFGEGCVSDTDCCPLPNDRQACVNFFNIGTTCTKFCTTNAGCDSGCCILLTNGKGACADPGYCGSKGSCASVAQVCTTDADCCEGLACVAQGSGRPKVCLRGCASEADCNPTFPGIDAGTVGGPVPCRSFSTDGPRVCDVNRSVLCTDTCRSADDGRCDDGLPGSARDSCTAGTDCKDCGPRVGGAYLCNDDCFHVDADAGLSAYDGICQDGLSGSKSGVCNPGTDCADCGPRLGICLDTCPFANNGSCDISAKCKPGTDCSDCGLYIVGRGQTPCDGSTGADCVPTGAFTSLATDGTCQCADCAWDSNDCGVTTSKCDGTTISACCAPGDPCHLAGKGYCACVGWCDWETADCGKTIPRDGG
jgi:hypothetical protein